MVTTRQEPAPRHGDAAAALRAVEAHRTYTAALAPGRIRPSLTLASGALLTRRCLPAWRTQPLLFLRGEAPDDAIIDEVLWASEITDIDTRLLVRRAWDAAHYLVDCIRCDGKTRGGRAFA